MYDNSINVSCSHPHLSGDWKLNYIEFIFKAPALQAHLTLAMYLGWVNQCEITQR